MQYLLILLFAIFIAELPIMWRILCHTYILTLDNAHNSQAQGLNLRRGRSLGGKRTVDINDKQTDGCLDEI